jgi:hypothetical protein
MDGVKTILESDTRESGKNHRDTEYDKEPSKSMLKDSDSQTLVLFSYQHPVFVSVLLLFSNLQFSITVDRCSIIIIRVSWQVCRMPNDQV